MPIQCTLNPITSTYRYIIYGNELQKIISLLALRKTIKDFQKVSRKFRAEMDSKSQSGLQVHPELENFESK